MSEGLPVEPASVTRLDDDDAREAADLIDYIIDDLRGALDSCDSVKRLCPQFAEAADLLHRKIVTVHQEAAALKAIAESGCAPAGQS